MKSIEFLLWFIAGALIYVIIWIILANYLKYIVLK